jgi:NADH:ubiquinone oxidoreductase subunit 5 (subunit L)/multisubunit Na+/H+ antiporter MnhA subunit
VVAFVWFLWVGQSVFLGRTSPAAASIVERPAVMDVTLVMLMVLCLTVGIAGLPLAAAVGPAAGG